MPGCYERGKDMMRLWQLFKKIWSAPVRSGFKDSHYACVVWGKTLRKVM